MLYALRRHIGVLEPRPPASRHTDQATAARQLGVAAVHGQASCWSSASGYDPHRLGRAYRALAVAETGLRGRAPATLETAAGVNHSDRLVVELALARLLLVGGAGAR